MYVCVSHKFLHAYTDAYVRPDTSANEHAHTHTHTHTHELLSIHENIFIRRLSTHSQTYTSQVRDTIAARYTDEEDAAENLHPSFIPSYQDRVLYGDPSKITLHYNVDTSLPPPPSSKHALPAEKEQEACHLEAASTRAGTDKASVLSPSPLTPAPASTPAPEVAQDQQQAASAQAWEQAARWQHLISSAPEAELPHVRALADLVLQRPPAFQQYDAARFAGRGVVMAAGGRLQIVNAYCVVRALRAAGCELPIELFYAGASEMSAHVVQVWRGGAAVPVAAVV